MREAWAHGRNFDPTHLEMFTAAPGFIIGLSILGLDELGGAGDDEPLEATFTQIQISSPTTVEDGLFVHREVETCNLSATLPEKLELRNRWIAIGYFGTEFYRGRIVDTSWNEAVDVGRPWLPGNTATKTYRVSLVATNSEDRLAGMSTPVRTFTNESLVERIESWTGLSVTEQDPAPDLPVNWHNAAWDGTTVRRIYRSTDDLGSLLDTLRAEARLRNMTFIYQPLSDPQFVLKPNNQWITGDLSGLTSLLFTDEPDLVLGQSVDPDDDYVFLGHNVSFTSRNIGMDPSMFTGAIVIRYGQYDVESPPADGEPVEMLSASYKASGANVRDVVVDLGTLDIGGFGSNPYHLTRAVLGTLPLRSESVPFTREIVTPFHAMAQLEGVVPGMARLNVDGVTTRVAVLGREHQITPNKWMIRYTLGPPHLLDRDSDYDPATPRAILPPIQAGAETEFRWIVPEYQSDVPIYEVLFQADPDFALFTSDKTTLTNIIVGIADPPGTSRMVSLSAATGTGQWVLYTSNPAPATTNPSPIWREGQPAFLGEYF